MTIKLFTVYKQIYMYNKLLPLLQQIENKEKHMYWKQTENIHHASQQNRIKQEMKESQKFVQSVTCSFM